MWLILLFIKFCIFQSTYADDVLKNSTKDSSPAKHQRTELTRSLLKDYEKLALPHDPSQGPVNVSFGLHILDFEFDAHSSSLYAYSIIVLSWNDPRLKWSSSSWSNVSEIKLDTEKIWLPDIVLYSKGDYNDAHTNAWIRSSGKILWNHKRHLIAMCEEDLSLWPRDTQTCIMRFGSWPYHKEEINLVDESPFGHAQLFLNFYTGSHKWKILSHNSVLNEGDPFFHNIKFSISIQRQAAGLRRILLLTALAVMVLGLILFCLPPASGERFLISCFNITIIVLHLIFFAWSLPLRGYLPRIVHFYACSLVLVLLSVVVSGLAGLLQRKLLHLPAPRWLTNCLSSGWLKFLCISGSSLLASTTKSGVVRLNDEGEQELEVVSQSPYLPLLAIADRMLLIVYVVLFIILLITYV